MAECPTARDFFAGQGKNSQESWRISRIFNAAQRKKIRCLGVLTFFKHALDARDRVYHSFYSRHTWESVKRRRGKMRCGKAEAPRRADARQGRQRSPRRILIADLYRFLRVSTITLPQVIRSCTNRWRYADWREKFFVWQGRNSQEYLPYFKIF